MPLEFALRPRFRLHDAVERPRRRRMRLPALALPVAGYWLGMAALTYALVVVGKGGAVQEREPEQEPAEERSALVDQTAAPRERPLDADSERPREQQPPVEPPAQSPPPPSAAPELDVPAEREVLAEDPQPEPRTVALPEQRQPSWSAEPPIVVPAAPTPEAVDPLPVSGALSSCEAVIASSNEEIQLGVEGRVADLSRDAFAAVLDNGAYLSGCAIPERTALEICVAVQEGRARGVTVVTRPSDARISACVKRAVAALRFPHSPRLDVTRTRFDARH